MARSPRQHFDHILGEDDGVIMVRDNAGEYFAVRRREWDAASDVDFVHAWRGPREKSRQIERRFLEEVDCGALREDKDGLWDCPPTKEDIRDDVLKIAESVIEDLANMSAASAWSTPSDDLIDQFGDVYVVAWFGDHVGVNGDVVMAGEWRRPDRWELTDRGGEVPSTEEQVDLESVVRHVTVEISGEAKRDIPEALVEDILTDEYSDRGYISTGVSGETEVWAPPESMRTRTGREREARFQPRPSPKVWSPRKKKR